MTRINASIRRPPAAAKAKHVSAPRAHSPAAQMKATVAGLKRLAKALQSLSPEMVSTSRTPELAKRLLERLERPRTDAPTISPKATVAAMKQLAHALQAIAQAGLLSTAPKLGPATQALTRLSQGAR